MKYSISQVSKIAGISIRTLHYYDQQNLLVPLRDSENGYREYTDQHMIVLQQILIYRQMDFSIAQIKQVLNQDEQTLFESLKLQKQTLKNKAIELDSLIKKVEISMNKLDKQRIDKILYEGIDLQKAEDWEVQARQNYSSESVDQSYKRLGKLSQEQLERIKVKGEEIAHNLAENLDQKIDSDIIQSIVKQHHAWVENFYDATFEVYTGLADMYLQSDEFTEFYDKHKKGSTLHLNQAIHYFAKHNL